MSGSVEMAAWQHVWPGAHVKSSERGAVTTELFTEFFAHWCQWLRGTLSVPLEEQVMLLLDSGGGSMSHLSTEVALLACKYHVRPFYLQPYHTCALCPLDMAPNREFERQWSILRSKSSNFSSLEALDCAHQCFETGYSTKHVLSGWRDVGLTAGLALSI